jgi:hypothetical protein
MDSADGCDKGNSEEARRRVRLHGQDTHARNGHRGDTLPIRAEIGRDVPENPSVRELQSLRPSMRYNILPLELARKDSTRNPEK